MTSELVSSWLTASQHSPLILFLLRKHRHICTNLDRTSSDHWLSLPLKTSLFEETPVTLKVAEVIYWKVLKDILPTAIAWDCCVYMDPACTGQPKCDGCSLACTQPGLQSSTSQDLYRQHISGTSVWLVREPFEAYPTKSSACLSVITYFISHYEVSKTWVPKSWEKRNLAFSSEELTSLKKIVSSIYSTSFIYLRFGHYRESFAGGKAMGKASFGVLEKTSRRCVCVWGAKRAGHRTVWWICTGWKVRECRSIPYFRWGSRGYENLGWSIYIYFRIYIYPNIQQHGSWVTCSHQSTLPIKRVTVFLSLVGSLGLGNFIVKQEFVVCSQRCVLTSTLPKTPGEKRPKGSSNPHKGEE